MTKERKRLADSDALRDLAHDQWLEDVTPYVDEDVLAMIEAHFEQERIDQFWIAQDESYLSLPSYRAIRLDAGLEMHATFGVESAS